uniref:Uncharacterized protein n=1 Tax=Anguilla anguilla TaxID=7936 RepID=A0A0E9PNT8_ANGAN
MGCVVHSALLSLLP